MMQPANTVSSYSTDEYAAQATFVRMRISGHLGADYAEFVAGRAAWLSVSGWIANVAPGQAEVVAAGPDVLVGALEMACMLGPSDALVETIEIEMVHGPVPVGFVVRT
ncbi:MAG: hypothetical protein ABIQ30_06020 [Devosia sp.]